MTSTVRRHVSTDRRQAACTLAVMARPRPHLRLVPCGRPDDEGEVPVEATDRFEGRAAHPANKPGRRTGEGEGDE